MAISIRKGPNLAKEGRSKGKITKVEPVTGNGSVDEKIAITVKTPTGNAQARCYAVMDDETFLGKFVAAVNGGVIPEYVDDIEELLLGKEVMVEVKHNASKKTGKLFANVVEVTPVPKSTYGEATYSVGDMFEDDTDQYDDPNAYAAYDESDDESDDEAYDESDDESDDEADAARVVAKAPSVKRPPIKKILPRKVAKPAEERDAQGD